MNGIDAESTGRACLSQLLLSSAFDGVELRRLFQKSQRDRFHKLDKKALDLATKHRYSYLLVDDKFSLNLDEALGAYTPLELAALLGDVKLAKDLLAAGASLEKGSVGALFLALYSNHLDLAKLFLSHYANPNALVEDVFCFEQKGKSFSYKAKRPLLQIAISSGSTEAFELLLSFGADLEQEDKNGFSALEVAVASSNERCKIDLIRQTYKESLDYFFFEGQLYSLDPIYCAVLEGDQSLLEDLVSFVDSRDFSYDKALYEEALLKAVDSGNLAIFDSLAKASFRPLLCDFNEVKNLRKACEQKGLADSNLSDYYPRSEDRTEDMLTERSLKKKLNKLKKTARLVSELLAYRQLFFLAKELKALQG